MGVELMVTCPFCGQLVADETETELDDGERILWAKRCCRCDGAKKWRMAQEAYEKIDRIVGEGAVEAGFDFAESLEAVQALKCAADDLIAGRYRKVQITTPGGDDVRLTAEPNGVKVKRVSKKQLAI